MEGKYGAIVIQTRVKECFDRRDVVDNLARACKVTHTSVRHPYETRDERLSLFTKIYQKLVDQKIYTKPRS